jgi:hypothetical protein
VRSSTKRPRLRYSSLYPISAPDLTSLKTTFLQTPKISIASSAEQVSAAEVTGGKWRLIEGESAHGLARKITESFSRRIALRWDVSCTSWPSRFIAINSSPLQDGFRQMISSISCPRDFKGSEYAHAVQEYRQIVLCVRYVLLDGTIVAPR